MKYVIGIDIGGSLTKICAFDETGKLITPMSVRGSDPLASFYGAFGKFTQENGISLSDISRLRVTGVGSSFVDSTTYGLPVECVGEFEAVGRGGLYLTGLSDALVVSMGTGTAMVRAKKDEYRYLGGTGVGGGTLSGLAKQILNLDHVSHVCALARDGDLAHVDLRISDMTRKNIIPSLPAETTAANFGKLSDLATPADRALGIVNLVFETIGMMAVFAARGEAVRDIVLTGRMAEEEQAGEIFANLSSMFHLNFLIPENARYGTVIGAALTSKEP
ncbi:MAG: type II pantothenate kinase [Clostridia bacterium]|nr:type II pantothenate kinase [Clostridia bacterium]